MPLPLWIGGSSAAAMFVLRPMRTDAADLMEQTRRLAEEVLPAVHGTGAAEGTA